MNLIRSKGFYYLERILMKGQEQYLQFLEDIINRHNANSFQLKELTITLVVAIYGIYIAKETPSSWLLVVPIIYVVLMAFLDSQYLCQEKKFRHLFEDAVAGKKELYDMNIKGYSCWLASVKSFSIWGFYGILWLISIVIFGCCK